MPRFPSKSRVSLSVNGRNANQTGAATLLVQPEDGITAIIQGIDGAKLSVDILIFRFDHREVEQALLRAAGRGVRVRALIAYTNRGGEKNLRALELRLLAAGGTAGRTHAHMGCVHQRTLTR